MTYAERLALALELSPYKPREVRPMLALAIGATTQAISQVLSGSTKALTAENTARAARFLQVDAYWLATGEGAPHPFLSDEAIGLARRYEALTPEQREKWQKALRRLEQSS
jgi:transcriptional regulator with XRE-family HTH domain